MSSWPDTSGWPPHLHVTTVASERQRATRFAARRKKQPTCKHPDCGTVLSIYNPDDFCYQHLPTTIMRRGGRRTA